VKLEQQAAASARRSMELGRRQTEERTKPMSSSQLPHHDRTRRAERRERRMGVGHRPSPRHGGVPSADGNGEGNQKNQAPARGSGGRSATWARLDGSRRCRFATRPPARPGPWSGRKTAALPLPARPPSRPRRDRPFAARVPVPRS